MLWMWVRMRGRRNELRVWLFDFGEGSGGGVLVVRERWWLFWILSVEGDGNGRFV